MTREIVGKHRPITAPYKEGLATPEIRSKPNHIIRTICYFTDNPTDATTDRLITLAEMAQRRGFLIQTKRLCSPVDFETLDHTIKDDSIYLGVGALSFDQARKRLNRFYKSGTMAAATEQTLSKISGAFNINMSGEPVTQEHADLLFEVIRKKPEKTFNFAFGFNLPPSSPFFPSAYYEKNGFSVGLQPTDLSENCSTKEEWFSKMQSAWQELIEIFGSESDFLGIDSSIAPLYSGKGSFINFIKRLNGSFENSVLTNTYLETTKFIKRKNPKPIGLCGLMLPCLEDFELADEYDRGNFSIERNAFLSLHSGLGIDVYPIGTDEDPAKVTEVLTVMQELSNKYKKPLSVRFVSDGKAKIGDKTNFGNNFFKDVTVRPLK